MEVLIDFERKPLFFREPLEVISCYHPAYLQDAFIKIEKALGQGFYLAGFFSYEAGYSFEERLREDKDYTFPMVFLGVYRKPDCFRPVFFGPGQFYLENFRINISRDKYASHIEAIRRHIAAGDVYQITYCIKFHFGFSGEPLALYYQLLRRQPVPYPAYIDAPEFKILSLSPERFLKKRGGRILAEPMKGTWPRGRAFLPDLLARRRFSRDSKNRAENVMIADLLRNDLGRVGEVIRAPRLFTVTGYTTLYQMTSTVKARVPQDIPLYELFRAAFPSGSVTGAPRIRAMQIIRGLESEERKIYTGAIGYISPDRDLYFNIPIRTILISGSRAEMGVGGGIVWDSTADGEWQEGMLKAKFLTELKMQAKSPLILKQQVV